MVKVPSATFSSWPFNVSMLTALIAQNKVYYFMCRTRYIVFPKPTKIDLGGALTKSGNVFESIVHHIVFMRSLMFVMIV